MRCKLHEVYQPFLSADECSIRAVTSCTSSYYLHNHHNDGRIALCCKVYPGDLEALIAFDPLRWYAPAYLGPKGWVGVRLDQLEVDWVQVAQHGIIAYRLVAPRASMSTRRRCHLIVLLAKVTGYI